jgi:3-hydroxyisobutyrate dehydrogenase-like beta-hydroxyacid dehydrogenase
MTTNEAHSHDVTVVGCGLMGAAIARALARAGYRVAAWNRTHARAEALAADGITPLRSIADAVGVSPTVIACVTTYADVTSALDPVSDWHGSTLINVTSGTADEATELARWAAERGAEYLDGGIFCYPKDIGTPEAPILFSGPDAVWSRHEAVLKALGGGSRLVGEEVATANLLYIGMSVFLFGAMSAYVEAATYLLGRGVAAETVREVANPPIDTLYYFADDATTAIASGRFETDQATTDIFADGARAYLDVLQQAGHPARVLAATVATLDAAQAAGLGHLGYPAQALVLGAQHDTPASSISVSGG